MLSSAPSRIGQLRSRPASRIPTVCVVDPQPDDYQSWQDAAHVGDLRLQIVASAEEALRLARTDAITLWVINTNLPGLSGFELCGLLKNQSPAATVWLVADEYSVVVEQAAWASRPTVFCCKATLAHHMEPVLWRYPLQSKAGERHRRRD